MPLIVILCFLPLAGAGCSSDETAPPQRPESSSQSSLNLRNHLGEQHFVARKYEAARRAFQEALAGSEDSVRAYVGLTHTYLALDEVTLAAEALDQVKGRDTTRAEVAYARAELNLEHYLKTHRGDLLEQALAAARRATRLAPDQHAYFFGLGNLYTHRGDLDSAETAYGRALTLNPGLALAHERLGSLYKYQGRFAEAQKAYQRQLELQPENARARSELAILYRAEGRRAAARVLLEEAVRLDTSLVSAYLNLGQLYLAEGRTEAGKKALERFRELSRDSLAILLAQAEASPRDAEAQFLLARAYVENSDYPRAEQLYLRTIRLDSNLVAARTALGRLYLLQQRLEEAEKVLWQARARDSSAVAVHLALGEVYLLQNRPDRAVEALERATELDAGQVRSFELLAMAHRQRGQHQKEREAREVARKLREQRAPE